MWKFKCSLPFRLGETFAFFCLTADRVHELRERCCARRQEFADFLWSIQAAHADEHPRNLPF
jgi:hypothetical protein